MTDRATVRLALLISGLALLVVAFGATHDLAPELPTTESRVVATVVDDGAIAVADSDGDTLAGACVLVLVCGAVMAYRRRLGDRSGRPWVVRRGARWPATQIHPNVPPGRVLMARLPILIC